MQLARSVSFVLVAAVLIGFPIGAGASAPTSPPLLIATGEQTASAPRPQIEVVSSSPRGVTLEFTLPALTVDEVTAIDGRPYQIVAIPGGGSTGPIGAPEIPVFTRLVSIPATSGVRIAAATVIEEETLSGYRLSPVQPDDTDRPGAFAYDATAYARDDFGPPTLSAAGLTGGPAILRDLRTVPLMIQPVRFNPIRGTLRVARRVRIEVAVEGTNLECALPTESDASPIAASFDRIYRELIVNYDPSTGQGIGGERSGSHVGVGSGVWVAICPNNDVVTHIQPLADWHKRKGTPVRIATFAETGSTKEAIRNWLVTAYATWPVKPEFVTLCGDGDGPYAVPYWTEELSGYYGGGDHPYAQLNGPDILADVHIGRLSFQTLTDLDTIVAKCVGYESTPSLSDPSWFTRACVVGDPNASGYSTVQVMQWAKTRLRQIGYTQVDTVFSGNFVGGMQTALNRGDTVFAYRGFYGMSGWGNSNTNALSNVWKLPFSVIITCDTGTFYSGTAVSEGFLRAGTAANPKGGIGAIGTATTGTHTGLNNCMTYGILYGLLYEGDYTMGAALTRGKYEMYLNFQQRDPHHVTIWCYWNNLMGDPGIECWTAAPTPLTVTAPTTVPIGTNSVTVSVAESGGGPCANAQVCLSKGSETYVIGTTGAAGAVELPVTLANGGSMLLTVSKHNRQSYLGTINVANSAVFVAYQSSTVSDNGTGGSAGNGDGLVNPGETIALGVQLKNFGTQTATGVTATLSSVDPYVAIAQNNESFGDISPLASAWSADSYVFTVSPACPHGHTVRFGLDVSSDTNAWHSLIDVPVVSAHLVAGGYSLYNAGPNGILDPGETAQLAVKLHNYGVENAAGVAGTFTSLSPLVYVPDGNGSWGNMPAGATGENNMDTFSITAAAQVYNGYIATFRLVNTYSGGLVDTSLVNVPIGVRATTDPTGPDQYGYLAYDDTDTRYPAAPVYRWIELDPTYGGTGTQLTLNDFGQYQDASVAIDLPFPFIYYGRSYTRATVCSNGWIAMASTYLTEYRNWTIPSAGGPQAMIAPLWDDLNLSGGGKVLTQYDAPGHKFIVEWSRVKNDPGNQETFEVILYDPAFYPTTTGDGQIDFQYNTVNNTDSVDNYVTTGIENIEHTDGVLYTYNALYTGGSPGLQAGRAIRFTTTVVDAADVNGPAGTHPVFMLGQNRPNPWQGSTTIRFSLEKAEAARLTVFDVQGRSIRTLRDGMQSAGLQQVIWDGRNDRGALAPTGVYFYRLETADHTEVHKLIRVQ